MLEYRVQLEKRFMEEQALRDKSPWLQVLDDRADRAQVAEARFGTHAAYVLLPLVALVTTAFAVAMLT